MLIKKKTIDILYKGISSGVARAISIIIVDLTVETIGEKRRKKKNTRQA